MFRTVRIVVCLFSCFALLHTVAVANDCVSILKGGIFDSKDESTTSMRLEIAKRTLCSTQTAGSLTELSASSKSLCDDSFSELLSTDSKMSKLRVASHEIVNAWSSCIAGSKGLVHYFQPTADPTTFFYRIVYNPFGRSNSVRLRSWRMVPDDVAKSCQDQPDSTSGILRRVRLREGTIIDPAGVTLLCRRNRDQQVSVVVNAVEESLERQASLIPASLFQLILYSGTSSWEPQMTLLIAS
jgi:hypothetical protein